MTAATTSYVGLACLAGILSCFSLLGSCVEWLTTPTAAPAPPPPRLDFGGAADLRAVLESLHELSVAVGRHCRPPPEPNCSRVAISVGFSAFLSGSLAVGALGLCLWCRPRRDAERYTFALEDAPEVVRAVATPPVVNTVRIAPRRRISGKRDDPLAHLARTDWSG